MRTYIKPSSLNLLALKPPYHIDQNPHKGNRGITRAWHAAKNSWCGVVYAFQEESAFRQELTLLIILTPTAIVIPASQFEHHDLSKRAKDFGSAAVMLTLLFALLIWLTIIIPLIFKFI